MNTGRTTRLYDHWLVRAVQTSRDNTSIVTRQRVPASAARGRLRQAPNRAGRCAICA